MRVAEELPECLQRVKHLFEPVNDRGHRMQRVVLHEFLPSGFTPNGIWIDHHPSLPRIFGKIIMASESCDEEVQPGMLCLFERYSGEDIAFDEATKTQYKIISQNDINAVWDAGAVRS